MDAVDGENSIADEELLYRRIPASTGWYRPADQYLSPKAFRPTDADATGLSVSRAKYKSLEDAGRGREGKVYYVAVLRAGDLRAQGVDIVPRPLPDDPGHAEIPALNAKSRDEDRAQEIQVLLAQELCMGVHGPYPDKATDS